MDLIQVGTVDFGHMFFSEDSVIWKMPDGSRQREETGRAAWVFRDRDFMLTHLRSMHRGL
jgi:hypothetical protein